MAATSPVAPASAADKQALRTLVRSMYDYQHLRIITGNRLAAHYRAGQEGMGEGPAEGADDVSPDAAKLIDLLRAEYRAIEARGRSITPGRMRTALGQHDGLISTPYELSLVRHYLQMQDDERTLLAEIAALVKEFAIWTEFLDGVRGCGPLMAAVIISELDPHKARHPSSFWKYAGLDVAPDGRGRSRRAEHLVERPYTNRDGQPDTRRGITFNPLLKTKLTGVLGSSFLRAGGHYGDIYRDYKHRLESHPRYGLVAEEAKQEGASKLHRHQMATRYAVKMFLLDLWKEWRRLEGLEVGTSYAEGKLGLAHGQDRAATG